MLADDSDDEYSERSGLKSQKDSRKQSANSGTPALDQLLLGSTVDEREYKPYSFKVSSSACGGYS